MTEFYSILTKELAFLNNPKDFQANFAVKNVICLFEKMQGPTNTMQMFFLSKVKQAAKKKQTRTIFNALKWFIMLHEAIRKAKKVFAILQIMDLLEGFTYSKPQKKHDLYLEQRLVKPYRQYLGKLAELINCKTETSEEQKNHIVYIQYNLILFFCESLLGVPQQLKGFFKHYYPCLNSYTGLLTRDISQLHKRVKISYRRGLMSQITKSQMQKMSFKVTQFRQIQGGNLLTWVDIDTDAESQSLESERQESIGKHFEGDETAVDQDWGQAISTMSRV